MVQPVRKLMPPSTTSYCLFDKFREILEEKLSARKERKGCIASEDCATPCSNLMSGSALVHGIPMCATMPCVHMQTPYNTVYTCQYSEVTVLALPLRQVCVERTKVSLVHALHASLDEYHMHNLTCNARRNVESSLLQPPNCKLGTAEKPWLAL